MANQPKAGTSVRGIRLDDTLWEALQLEAAKQGISSTSVLIRQILTRYLNRRKGETAKTDQQDPN